MGIIHWLHARIARPLVEWWDETVLGTWEESLKSIIREAFQATNRFLNGISAWVLGVFDSDYRENLKKSWKQQQDWHSWWREDHASTLNAVIAQCPSAKVQGKPITVVSNTATVPAPPNPLAAWFMYAETLVWCPFSWRFALFLQVGQTDRHLQAQSAPQTSKCHLPLISPPISHCGSAPAHSCS